MLFNSFDFLFFFPVVCFIYYMIPSLKWRNVFLLAASYYFYMNTVAAYALILLSSTVVTYVAALGIDKFQSTPGKKKGCLIASLAINLLILLFFKYYYFAGENLTALMRLLGVELMLPDFDILLPVGISFYTFQSLGYTFDVYRGTIKAERNFLRYALFVSFFPQLVAGPVERSTNLLKQFKVKHKFDTDQALDGVKVMIWGYFLKLVLADRCAIYVDSVYNNIDSHPQHSTLLATILFCFQLYGDFAGYTYIAIGAARIMGFKLMDNFNHPYLFSTSVQDYWRRNHISMTTWFTDYIYYPIAERRDTLNWWCFAIFVTFLVSGFWHGAAWTFIFWGAIQGLLLIAEMKTNKKRKRWEKRLRLNKKGWYIWMQRLLTFAIICLSLVFFRANSLGDAFSALKMIFDTADFTLNDNNYTLCYCVVAGSIMFCREYYEEYNVRYTIAEKHKYASNIAWMLFLSLCILFLGVFDGGNFIYFKF